MVNIPGGVLLPGDLRLLFGDFLIGDFLSILLGDRLLGDLLGEPYLLLGLPLLLPGLSFLLLLLGGDECLPKLGRFGELSLLACLLSICLDA